MKRERKQRKKYQRRLSARDVHRLTEERRRFHAMGARYYSPTRAATAAPELPAAKPVGNWFGTQRLQLQRTKANEDKEKPQTKQTRNVQKDKQQTTTQTEKPQKEDRERQRARETKPPATKWPTLKQAMAQMEKAQQNFQKRRQAMKQKHETPTDKAENAGAARKQNPNSANLEKAQQSENKSKPSTESNETYNATTNNDEWSDSYNYGDEEQELTQSQEYSDTTHTSETEPYSEESAPEHTNTATTAPATADIFSKEHYIAKCRHETRHNKEPTDKTADIATNASKTTNPNKANTAKTAGINANEPARNGKTNNIKTENKSKQDNDSKEPDNIKR